MKIKYKDIHIFKEVLPLNPEYMRRIEKICIRHGFTDIKFSTDKHEDIKSIEDIEPPFSELDIHAVTSKMYNRTYIYKYIG